MSSDHDVVLAPRWWRLTVGTVVGLLIAGSVAVAVVDGYVRQRSAGAITAATVELFGVAALVSRRRWITAVLVVELAVAVVTAVLPRAPIHTGAIFLAVVALYTFGTLRSSRRTIVAAVATAVTVATLDCIIEGTLGPLIPDLALFTAVTAVSFYVRSHRELMVSYRERAEQAEEAQQWIASRAVAAERVRLARELHDVVAHHVSLLVVQAGAVRETLPADHVTRPVLDSMIDGGRQAMSEMRSMLDALRLDSALDGRPPELPVAEPAGRPRPWPTRGPGRLRGSRDTAAPAPRGAQDAVAAGPPRVPQPTADQIPLLVTGAQAAGLPVTLRIDGDAVAAPPGTALAAYRIVQEALTNALKHAPGAFTTVHLRYEPRTLAISVRNGPAPLPPVPAGPAGRGHGIVGMRERAGLAHGTLRVGPTADGWEVDACLPLDAAFPSTPPARR
jgi:signal transduction histidine kinase